MQIEIETKGTVPVVHLNGEVDIYTCPQLNKALNQIYEDGSKNLIVDLENVHYIDSTGLGTIAHVAKKIATREGEIGIISTKPQIVKIFEISGLSKKNVSLFDNQETAVKQLS